VEVVKCVDASQDKIILHINGERRDTYIVDAEFYQDCSGEHVTLFGNWGRATFHKSLIGNIEIN
jgi:hypothetical protein